MSIRKAAIAALLAAAGMAVSSVSMAQSVAQDRGWYLGGSIGQAKLKEGCDGRGVAGLVITSCDDKNTSWKLLAGALDHPEPGNL